MLILFFTFYFLIIYRRTYPHLMPKMLLLPTSFAFGSGCNKSPIRSASDRWRREGRLPVSWSSLVLQCPPDPLLPLFFGRFLVSF